MPKIEEARLWYMNQMLYKPDLEIELRPDRKRLVVKQPSGDEKNEIWIDVGDVAAFCKTLTGIVQELRANQIIEDAEVQR